MKSLLPVSSVERGAVPRKEELLSPELARLLAEVGFLAIDQKDGLRAQRIFSVLQEFRMNSEFAYVGLALNELMRSNPVAAVEAAKKGLSRVPDSEALAFVLSIAVRQG